MRITLIKLYFCMLAGLASTGAFAQFNFSVYEGNFSVLPNFSTLTPTETGTSSIIDTSVTTQTETFALVFTRNITISSAGDYEFSASSDDGSKIYIDGATVVDNDGLHGNQEVTGSINLDPGTYSFRVEFFERYGNEILTVGYKTNNSVFEPIPPNGELVISGLADYGQWGPVIQWPHIAISAANLPDGRVLSWSSTETNAFPSGGSEFTHASVFDPQTETFVNVDNNFHDMFCAGISTLENGVILASGGNPDDRRTTAFDPATLSWMPRADMLDKRWYGANITLPNGRVFSTFAKSAGNRSEVYDPASNSWSATPNANMQTLVNEQNAINSAQAGTPGVLGQEWWSHIAAAPQGDVFQGGPTQSWHRFDPTGGGATIALGQPIGDTARMYGNAVTYDAGKVLLVGGADRRADPPTSVNNVYLVDLNGPAPIVTPGAPMNFPRALSNTVTLPNGEVLVVGGNTVAKIFNDQGSVLPAEIYSPASDSWRIVDSISVPRNYHSTALLLKDGRVLSAGGGACGGCSADHLDGQIFSPPYLFDPDGNPATRPTMAGTPGQIEAGDQIVVTASNDTMAFTMVRLSGTTHHLNTDQRFLPVASVNNGDGSFTLALPANPNVVVLGNYWLFAVNSNGTPSLGHSIQVIRSDIAIPPTQNGDVYLSDLAWQSEINGWGPAERDTNNGGDQANDGGPLVLNGTSYAKGIGAHAYSEISVDLAGQYERFKTDIGLDDARDGLCGNVRFEIDVDGINQFSSNTFIDTTPTQSIDLGVADANTLTLKVLDSDGSICGDHADWADARLTPTVSQGYRYYRFTPTKLRNDTTANSVQLAELAFKLDTTRINSATVVNPGGNNPVGQEPALADDNTIASKWLDYNKGALVYDYNVNTIIDSYAFTTADDAVERDPVRWLLEGSKDALSWVIIDDQTDTDFATPVARNTAIGDINVVLPSVIVALPEPPRNSSTLLVEDNAGSDRIWNVNPDNNSVSVSDASGSLLAEISVGTKPWSLAKRPTANSIYVTNKQDASVSVINTATLAVDQTIALPYGSQPHGIVFESDGSHYYVVLEATATLEKRNASTHTVVNSLVLGGTPRHASMRFDDSRVFVSNFITPPLPGESTAVVNTAGGAAEIFAVEPNTMTLANTIALTHDNRSLSESQGPGIPNYLGAPVVSFDDAYAYIASKKDNVDSGGLRLKPGMTFDSTVRANTSRIELATETEDPTLRVDHDNSSVGTHAALTGDNRYLLTSLETSRELAIYDTKNGFELMRLPTGRAPQSVALSSDGSQAYVHNFMDRSISRFDLTQMLETDLPATNVLPTINVVSTERLASNVLLGKQLFYDAQDDRLALDDYMSCAACHKEGKHDGRVWDLSSLGEGLRRTISLQGKGSGHGILHWSGNFDEVQDFENQIRNLNFGSGLMNQADYDATVSTLGPSKAGLSTDLDALASYVTSLVDIPDSPHRATPSTLSSEAQTGKSLFFNKGCTNCHAAPVLTDSPAALLHDVGTIDSDSGQRLGAALAGFDTPSVVGAWSSPPYLHDGSAATMQAAISAHTNLPPLPTTELDALASFIQQAEASDTIDMVDSDGDSIADFEDPASGNPCIPSAFNVNTCLQDTDEDTVSDYTEGEFTDSDGDGTVDYLESSLADADADGVNDQADSNNSDSCIPSAFNVNTCLQDTDEDTVSDYTEGEFTDSDGDGTVDYLESSLADADADGVNDQADSNNSDSCIPSAFNSNCDQDSDGDLKTDFAEGQDTDTDGDGSPDYQESSLLDEDSDGTVDELDPANADACLPSAFNGNCDQDSDGDLKTDFAEGQDTDTDGDGSPDYQESSLLDEDSDGTVDELDPANADACLPSAFNGNCDQDSDGDLKTDFAEGQDTDTDGDGSPDYQESSLLDEDSDGTVDELDPANADACLPSAFNGNCDQDSDGDLKTDFAEGQDTDTDGDGSPDYQESSLLDEDSDGTVDELDPANADACLPSAFNGNCDQDSDGDLKTDFAEGQDTDTDGDGSPDYQESSLLDEDSDGTVDELDPANADACLPSAFNGNCDQDSDGDLKTDFAEGQDTDTDGDGSPDYQESSLLDEDSDGAVDELDPANADACLPSAFNGNCDQDSDGDLKTDFAEGQDTDTDGDGSPDYQESSLLDEDSDGTVDELDPANADACLPSAFNGNCDQDSDGDLKTDFAEGQDTDTDGDGSPDYQESSLLDEDSDGTVDELDPANADACLPSAFNGNCDQDSDGDGVTDFTEGEFTDSDGDGMFDYQESSMLDDDGDTYNNQQDPDNDNNCVPELHFCSEVVPMLPWMHSALLALALAGLIYRRKRAQAAGAKS